MLNTFENVAKQQARRRERERRIAAMHQAAAPSADEFLWSDDNFAPAGFTERMEPEMPRTSWCSEIWRARERRNSFCCVVCIAFLIIGVTGFGVGFRTAESEGLAREDFDSSNMRYNQLYNAILDWGYTSGRVLENESSPQAQALRWLSEEDIHTTDPEVVRTRFALASIYFSTTDIVQVAGTPTRWRQRSHWLSSYPVCLWHGVECIDEDETLGRVQALNLSSNGLAGTIAREIGLLKSDIKVLDLGNNEIHGTIPPSIKDLASLEQLFLGVNYLNSTIPSELFQLSRLEHLFINDCLLTGSIPDVPVESMPNLQALGLYSNFLESTIPRSVGLLRQLHVLYLDENNLEGQVPDTLGQLGRLIDLRLGHNQLSGTIPTTLGELSNCRILYMEYNTLTGPIPTQLGRPHLLRELHLYRNQLSGPLPNQLMSLPLMNVMYLDNNRISGTLPTVVGDMKYLESLYIGHNKLNGSLPTEMGELGSLEKLSLQFNRFSGRIPGQLANCQNLGNIFLNNNTFTGSLPSDLGQILSLKRLRIYGNDLTSEIPSSFCSPTRATLDELTADCRQPFPKVTCTCCSSCY